MKTTPLVILIEHDPSFAAFLREFLVKEYQFAVSVFTDFASFLHSGELRPQLIFLNYRLPDQEAGHTVPFLKNQYPDSHLIVISGSQDQGQALHLLSAGVNEYLLKDSISVEKLKSSIEQSAIGNQRVQKHPYLTSMPKNGLDFYFACEDKESKKLAAEVDRLAGTSDPLLLTGGIGMECAPVCRRLVRGMNAASVPVFRLKADPKSQERFEADLVGITGPNGSKGALEWAEGGLLVIDDVAELNLANQALLANVMMTNVYRPVDSIHSYPLRTRILCFTRHHLWSRMETGQFLEDLFFFLSVNHLELPLLNERKPILPRLVNLICSKIYAETQTEPVTFDTSAQKALEEYSFPGNYAELIHLVRYSLLTSTTGVIRDTHIRHYLERSNPAAHPGVPVPEFRIKPLEELTNEYIYKVLKHYKGSVNETASALKISKSTIYNLIRDKKV